MLFGLPGMLFTQPLLNDYFLLAIQISSKPLLIFFYTSFPFFAHITSYNYLYFSEHLFL